MTKQEADAAKGIIREAIVRALRDSLSAQRAYGVLLEDARLCEGPGNLLAVHCTGPNGPEHFDIKITRSI